MEATKELRVIKTGIPSDFPDASECAFTDLKNCAQPGFSMELWKLVAEYFGAELELHQDEKYGMGDPLEKNSTMQNLLHSNYFAAGPFFDYISERLINAPKVSFPLGPTRTVAAFNRTAQLASQGAFESVDLFDTVKYFHF